MLKYLAMGEKNSMKHCAIKFVSAAGRWFSPGTPVCSTMSTDRHDITEILLKVELNTINLKNLNLSMSGTDSVRTCILHQQT